MKMFRVSFLRLGLMDPDLPPPGPPTMRSFKVSGAVSRRRQCVCVELSVMESVMCLLGVSAEHGGQCG